jgi:SPX domain protein involved in polyphosphate accumulation
MQEIYAFLWQYDLHPACVVRYERQAFIGTDYDLGLRVTFDTSLSYQTRQLILHEKADSLPILPQDNVVMEIKVNERIPYWLTELIAAYNLNMVRISKYCRSIELATGWASTPERYALTSL